MRTRADKQLGVDWGIGKALLQWGHLGRRMHAMPHQSHLPPLQPHCNSLNVGRGPIGTRHVTKSLAGSLLQSK